MEEEFFYRIVLGVLFLLLSIFAIIQIYKLIYNRHNIQSFHFKFLILCLSTSLLRQIYFFCSAYNITTPLVLFLTNGFPVVLQLSTFSLLVVFFKVTLNKSKKQNSRQWFIYCWILLSFTILLLVIFLYEVICDAQQECLNNDRRWNLLYALVYLILSIFVGYYGIQLSLALNKGLGVTPEVQRKSWAQVLCLTIAVIICFLTRFIFNSIVAAQQHTTSEDEMSFSDFCLLTLWDITPNFVVLLFFRNIPTPGKFQKQNSHSDDLHPHEQIMQSAHPYSLFEATTATTTPFLPNGISTADTVFIPFSQTFQPSKNEE
eukprot:c16346_g1_i2.p1 GENE.c16346_g1_i2~~c16346_g1_i2.p1  ORF type:complete len:317 (+),score=75.67 c16346_g1_i2:44-994(+)